MPRFFHRAFALPVFVPVIGVAVAMAWVSGAMAAPPEGYKLVWSDEFDGNTLDTNKFSDKQNREIADRVQHTLHWDGYGESHQSQAQSTPEMGLATGFHVYGFEWTGEASRFFVDGKLTWTCTKAISNANEFTILSSEVQDYEWAGRTPGEGYGERAASKTRMVVDYVRCYARD